MVEALVYEPLTDENIRELSLLLADPEVYAHVEPQTPTPDWIERSLLVSRAGPKCDAEPQIWHHFVVRSMDSGSAVGNIQATVHADVVEIGFMFGRAYWGKGIAFHALTWLQETHLRELEPTRFWATTAPANHRCQALMKRLGYREVDYTGVPKLLSYDPGDLVFRRAVSGL